MGVRNPADFISRHTGSTQAVQYSRQRKILEKRTLICVTQTKMKEISPTITASQNAEPPRGTETAHSVFCVQLDETPAWSSKLRICWLTAWYNCGLRSPAPPLSPWANFHNCDGTNRKKLSYWSKWSMMWHAEQSLIHSKCSENVCHWYM